MSKKWFVSFLIVLFFLGSVPLSLAEANTPSLKIGITKDENTLTPYTYVTGYPGLDLVNLVYDNLFHLDEANQPIPWLVDQYSVSDDGLEYKFTLHENIQWQDGEPLTAEDVKFTMEYYLEYPKARFTNPLKRIDSITVHDPTSFSIKLSQADANFMVQPLADIPILPQHIWSDITNPDEATNALGSGPYILEDYRSGQYYTMRANPTYFMGKPSIEEIIFPIIEDTTALYTALQAREIDAISSSISPELVNQFESNPNLKVARGAGYSAALLQLNAEKYPMSEKEFRQAISYAIDTQYLVDTVLLGFAEVGSPGFIHPASPYFNSSLSFEKNIEKAKEILEQAGFTDSNGDGFIEGQNGEPVQLTTLVYSNNPIRIRTAEIVTEWLLELGIQATVRAMDSTTVDSLMWPDFDVSKGRDFDLGVWGWSSTMQLFPDRLIDLFHSDPTLGSSNIGGYVNTEFDQLADQLKATLDEDARLELIHHLQQFVADEAPIVPLYYQEIVNAYNPNVYDGYTFQLGKGIIHKLSFVLNDSEESGTSEEEPGETVGESTPNETGTGSGATGESGSNSGLILLAGLVIVIIVVLILLRAKTGRKKIKEL